MARRLAQKHGLNPGSDFDAVRLLRAKGIDPFDRANMLELVHARSKPQVEHSTAAPQRQAEATPNLPQKVEDRETLPGAADPTAPGTVGERTTQLYDPLTVADPGIYLPIAPAGSYQWEMKNNTFYCVGRQEDPVVVGLNGLYRDSGGQVCLAGARPTDEDDVLRIVEKLAAVQRSDERLIDTALSEVEARQIPIGREAGGLHLVVDRADLAFSHLGLEQGLEDWDGLLIRRCALFGQVADGIGHAKQLEGLERGDHGIGRHDFCLRRRS